MRLHHKLAISIACFSTLAPTALPQGRLASLKERWRAREYRAVLGPLMQYKAGLGDAASFEVDYMLGTALCGVVECQVDGCAYLQWVASNYRAPFLMDGQDVDVTGSLRSCACAGVDGKTDSGAPTAGGGPGVFVRRSVIHRTPAQILEGVKQKLATTSSAGRDFNGAYNMVHDGWRGALVLNYPGGEYTASDGKRFPVRTSVDGYHIRFYVIGLGGENADGTGGQKFDGYLMTQTKDAIAGTTWWGGNPFGFYAVKR